ncbi:MAG TPA: hypothetical protein VF981_15875 [Gemmatimonadaceae bacterium]
MSKNRRQFLGNMAALSAGGVLLPSALGAAAPEPVQGTTWDLSWRDRVAGDFRAVFDSPEINDGVGLWRAADWKRIVRTVYGDAAKDASAVLVIRQAAIPMAMNHAFWERHAIGEEEEIKAQGSEGFVKHNPHLSLPDTTANQRNSKLDGFIADGGIVLACNYAFGFMVQKEAKKAGVASREARAATMEYLVPGVILQPSGFFAALEAQRAGCHFFLAS